MYSTHINCLVIVFIHFCYVVNADLIFNISNTNLLGFWGHLNDCTKSFLKGSKDVPIYRRKTIKKQCKDSSTSFSVLLIHLIKHHVKRLYWGKNPS